MDRLQSFIHSPSRNHLVISNGCLDGLKYIDVGFEVSCFIEEIIGDRRLSMRVQDNITKLFREHIFQSDSLGQYLAITNVGIILVGDRIPQNLLTEDEVLLQYYDIASSKV